MAVDINTPVTEIQGIGPVTADLLKHQGVEFVLELVRVRADQLHAVLDSVASYQECKNWIHVAHLLQVSEVTPQWAEALVAHDLKTVEMLARSDFDDLKSIFNQALQINMIPGKPTDLQLAEMVRDATVIYYTGSITGTVLDHIGAGLADAKVEVGLNTTYTNANGHFRVLRIPLNTTPVVIISHENFLHHVADEPKIIKDDEVIVSEKYALAKLSDSSEPASSNQQILDEFNGVQLPPTSAGLELTTERQQGQQLRVGDILMVHKFYKNGLDVMLQSRFRCLKNGRIVIKTYRVPVSILPDGVQLKDHVEQRTSGLRLVNLTPARLARRKALRRVASTLSYSPETRQERRDYLMTIAEKMAEEPEFSTIIYKPTNNGG